MSVTDHPPLVGLWNLEVTFTEGPLNGRVDQDVIEFLPCGFVIYRDGRGIGPMKIHCDSIRYNFYYIVEDHASPVHLVRVSVDARFDHAGGYNGTGTGRIYTVNAEGEIRQTVRIRTNRA